MLETDYIEAALQRLNWDKVPHGLYDPIAYALQSGGKRLRPTLVLLSAQMFGASMEDALPAALAIELFHNFTLLHDDVMDHALLRRGQATVQCRWNPNTAILSGDQMLIEAYQQLSLLPLNKQNYALQIFNKMATEICEGQQLDADFEAVDEVDIEEYITMIRLKTSVLLGTALQLGAYLGSASDQDQTALYEFGVALGLAFQIQDDVLDVWGNPATFGKAIGGDILEGKKTFVFLSALRLASESQKQALQHEFASSDRPKAEKIAAVTALYDALNVRPVCEEAMRNYTTIALASLGKVAGKEEKKLILKNLAYQLLARKE